jgi:outer membrane protein OmpA-like peptidoglycan-associated protein
MRVGQLCAAVIAAGICTIPSVALAQASRLNLIIGGEAYDGPPKFEVTFDGEVLGEGEVAQAIDTATTGRFADATDKTPYVQSFEFVIPDYLFKPEGEVRVRLVNEAYGGDGSNRDRNLYLAAVTINGGAVTVSGLVTATSDGFSPNEMVGEFLMLKDGNEQGVSPAPRGGWPQPPAVVSEVAQARLMPEADNGAERLPVPGLTEVTAPAVAEAAVETASTVEGERLTTASIENDGKGCTLDQLYNVIGFNENSNDLTPRLEARLDQIIEDIGAEKCRVQVTGYSSTQGAHATNALFAVERAQNVLAYLRENGLQYEKATAAGGGATTQFGEDFASNRRVVIIVTP